MAKKYNTRAKRIAFATKRGSILTFKSTSGLRKQIIVDVVEEDKKLIRITGVYNTTGWQKMDDLLEMLDWEDMERMHEDE